jgi:hypothetical protein
MWATSAALFAGTLMVMIGIFSILQGLAALIDDDFFTVLEEYAYDIDATAWGWIHLIAGVIVMLAGFYIFTGALWARIIGIAIALLSAIINFFWIPYYPFWAILIIAIDVVVIWGLAVYGRETSMA